MKKLQGNCIHGKTAIIQFFLFQFALQEYKD